MPYTDYSGFDQSYFEGASVADPDPAGYSDYRRSLLPFDWYASKLAQILTSQGINPNNEKVLVTGCAYGFTVEYLIDNEGMDAYGMDTSSWAVQQASTATAYGDRIYQGDIRNQNDIKSVRQSTPGGPFGVIYNECTLSCLTDSEAQTACDNLRKEVQESVVHRVWSQDGSDVNPTYYNTKSISEWQSLCDPNDDDDWRSETEFQP